MTEIFNMMTNAMGDLYEEPYESTQARETLPKHLRRIMSRDYAGVNESFWILFDAADELERGFVYRANGEARSTDERLQRSELLDRLARLCHVAERSLRQPHPFDETINIPDQRRELRFELEQCRALIGRIEATFPSISDADLVGASQEQRVQHSPTDGVMGANGPRVMFKITVVTMANTRIEMPNATEDDAQKFIAGLENRANQFFTRPGATRPNAFIPFHAIAHVDIEPLPSPDGEKG